MFAITITKSIWVYIDDNNNEIYRCGRQQLIIQSNNYNKTYICDRRQQQNTHKLRTARKIDKRVNLRQNTYCMWVYIDNSKTNNPLGVLLLFTAITCVCLISEAIPKRCIFVLTTWKSLIVQKRGEKRARETIIYGNIHVRSEMDAGKNS